MSRAENSDNRRIREMNEAAFQRKVQEDKKSQEARTERSFQEVMQDRARQKLSKDSAKEETAQKKGQEQESVLDRIKKQAPKDQVEHQRRQALQRQMKGGLLKKQTLSQGEAARAEASRTEELTTKAEAELEHVEKDVRKDDERETVRSDEKQAEVLQESRGEGNVDRTDQDGRQKQRQDRGSGGEPNQDRTAQVDGVRRGARVQIPQEVLQRLVSAIYKAVTADGRTEMRITLKGGKLEGVTVQIHAENGKVRCEFSNCSKEIAGMLKQGTRALAQGLSRRGLKLERLTVAND